MNELSYIKKEADCIKIGAGTSLADIITSSPVKENARALSETCEKVGAITIQHYRGTIGGNILRLSKSRRRIHGQRCRICRSQCGVHFNPLPSHAI